MKIPPGVLVPARPAWMDVSEVEFPGTAGLFTIFGKNNSGKSHLLKALEGAALDCAIRLADLSPELTSFPFLASGLSSSVLPDVTLRWSRPEPWSIHKELGNSPARDVMAPDPASSAIARFSPEPHQFLGWVCTKLKSQRLLRSACLIPTNRHFVPNSSINGDTSLASLSNWPSVFENLRKSPTRELREAYGRIVEDFRGVTDGLSFELLGEGNSIGVYIREGQHDPIPLAGCGDGLRDLLGIIAHVHIFPQSDLFVEEPGTRLHPHAQRRLMQLFLREGKTRAVWITSHDPLFASSSAVSGVFAIRREVARRLSIVCAVASVSDLRGALVEGGFRPSDIAMADGLILCEGPSDQLVFSALAVDDSEADSSVEIVQLGGDSVLREGSRRKAVQYAELLVRAAPFARCCMVFDRGTMSDESRLAAESQFKDLGIGVAILARNELEDYFLDIETLVLIVDAIFEEAAGVSRVQMAKPVRADVERAFGETDPNAKGSARIAATCESLALRYSKRSGARAVAAALRCGAIQLPELKAELRAVRTGKLRGRAAEVDGDLG